MFGLSKKKSQASASGMGVASTSAIAHSRSTVAARLAERAVRPDPFATKVPTPLARLLVDIDPARVDRLIADGTSRPAAGDVVELDQGFTGSNGEPMLIVYCKNPDGTTRWGADVFEDEIEPL